MARRTTAKRKGKAKRKKTLVSKVAARKKATAVRKTKAIRKKAPKRAPVRRVSSKKAKPAANVAVEAAPASAPAEPEAVGPMPGLAAQPTPPAEPGERIGVVTHYYSHLSVAIMRLESGTLRVGDVINIRVARNLATQLLLPRHKPQKSEMNLIGSGPCFINKPSASRLFEVSPA